MSLSLTIVAFKGQPRNLGETVVFDNHGGTIGRSDENRVVLPDPEKFVSRRHATITFADGQYTLTDSSLSGTYIDGQEMPLSNQTCALADGMRLKIGEYEIRVSISAEQAQEDFAFDPFSSFQPAAADGLSSGALLASENLLDHRDDLLNQLVKNNSSSLLSPPDEPFGTIDQTADFSGILQENIPSIHDSFVPPVPAANAYSDTEIPDDFNFEDLFADTNSPELVQTNGQIDLQHIHPESPGDVAASATRDEAFPVRSENKPDFPSVSESFSGQAAAITAAPAAQAPPASSPAPDHALFNAFLQGAGLADKGLAPDNAIETMRLTGAMFRQLAEGLVAVLRSRSEFKSQFRVSMTTIKTQDNNPLKFAVMTDDVLGHLLNNGQGGFKKSLPAIDEGFTDIIGHQMAMQAGIQAALAELFGKFDPKRIEKQFEEGLVLQKKSKCWEKYVASYPGIVEQTTEDFFGEAFAEAYEMQMKRFSGQPQK